MRIRSGFATTAMTAGCTSSADAASGDRPNVFMLADDMGFGASRTTGAGCSAISNIERDPRETGGVAGTHVRVRGRYMKTANARKHRLKDLPNPPTFSMTDFDK